MGAAVQILGDFSASWFRDQAKRSKDGNQARRLLALAAIVDGESREVAAKIGGMDRQTLRDWVNRFNEGGVEALRSRHAGAPPRKLSAEQEDAILKLIEMEPIPDVHGCVRWRIVDLCGYAYDEWGISIGKTAMSDMLRRRGYRLLSPRPQHPNQDPKAIETFKKRPSLRQWQRSKDA